DAGDQQTQHGEQLIGGSEELPQGQAGGLAVDAHQREIADGHDSYEAADVTIAERRQAGQARDLLNIVTQQSCGGVERGHGETYHDDGNEVTAEGNDGGFGGGAREGDEGVGDHVAGTGQKRAQGPPAQAAP